MPMMAAYEHNDARDSARLLASRTLEGLRHRDRAPSFENAINNMYRLLQGFRSHRFYGYSEQVQPDGDTPSSSMLSPSDRNVSDLKGAIEDAFSKTFQGEDANSAIDHMKVVLRVVAYPEPGEDPEPNELKRTERFFEVLLKNLEA